MHAPQGTYFCSLSSRTVVYKEPAYSRSASGFLPRSGRSRIRDFVRRFHQRYSTNTQPSWALAQPFRFVAHNGEINTISANRRWVHAKERLLKESLQLPDDVGILEERVSDSASFDNGLELLLRQNYTPAAGMLAMVPPAWETNPQITPDLRRFLEAHAPVQEPWDGPAAMVFTDGLNGGREARSQWVAPAPLYADGEMGCWWSVRKSASPICMGSTSPSDSDSGRAIRWSAIPPPEM